MPYDIRWHEEKRVILLRFIGDMAIEESVQSAVETEDYLKQGEAPVHLVIDVSALGKFTTNVSRINTMVSYFKSPDLGWVVLVGGNTLTNFVTSVASRVIKFKTCQQRTLDEAFAYLATQNATLKAEPQTAS